MKLLAYFLFFLLMPKCFLANTHEYSSINLINNKREIAVKIILEDGWKIYGPNVASIGQPTKLFFKTSSNIKNIEPIWPKGVESKDFGTEIYEQNIIIPLKTDFIDPNSKKEVIEVNYSYVLCNDMCIPISGNLKEILNLNETNPEFNNFASHNNLPYILLIALLGGFILNFMPCVLPIVSLKIYSLVKVTNSGNSHRHLISMILGIVFTFMVISLLTISLKNAGEFAGLHIHFQQPIFIITLFLVLVIFIANLQGLIEISLPIWVNNLLNQNLFSSKKFIGDFFAGMLAAILATPCTAPFVTIAISYALTQTNIIVFIIFLFLGIGFSLPYIIFLIYPKLLQFLPKPGAWLLNFKKIIAIILSATCLWFLYILSEQLDVKASIILLGLGLIFKFALSKPSKFKYIFIIIIIVLSYFMPLKMFKDDLNNESKIDSTWQDYQPEKIDQLILNNKIIIVDITASWCMSCKINKFLILDNADNLLELKKNKNIIFMRKNITSSMDQNVNNLLKQHQRHGIPFNIVYGPKKPEGIVLPIILTKSLLVKAISEASGN